MDRRSFTRLSATALLGAPGFAQATRPRINQRPNQTRTKSMQRVAIVGVGSAGLAAAYHLKKSGFDVQVLEAAAAWGGRIRRLTDFSDVPLDLGAEWIHDDPTVLGRIIGEAETDLDVETIRYRPRTYQFWHKGKLKNFNTLRYAYEEVKFLNTTWYGFFEKFVLPQIYENVQFNAPVSHSCRKSISAAALKYL